MSESATFTSPASATTGLQSYSLERPAKNLFPGPDVSRVAARLKMLARKKSRGKPSRRHVRLSMSKDAPMKDTIAAMVEALAKSVSEACASASTPELDALLKKNFDEFQAALEGEVEETLTKLAPDEDADLYKGLGTVGRVADLTKHLAGRIERIKLGKDYDGDTDEDPASPEVSEVLDHALGLCELALREAVNEHVDIPEEDEEPTEGVHFIAVPMVAGGEQVMKCALPEELAKFATDPAQLDQERFALGAQFLLEVGVPEETLGKLFEEDEEPLGKEFPPPKKKKGPPQQSSSAGSDDGSDDGSDGAEPPDDGTDPGDVPQGDPSQDPTTMGQGGGMDDGGDDPLTILGQLLAAAMIQCNHIQEMVSGAGDPSQDPSMDQGATSPVAAGTNPAMGKRQARIIEADPDEDALEKYVSERVKKDVEAQLSPFRSQLEKFLNAPAEGRAIVGAAAVPSKQRDSKVLEKVDPDMPSQEELAKMTENERFQAMAKRAFSNPIPLIPRGP